MAQTLLIGLDGATYTVLNPLMEQGIMPFLKEFLARGAQGILMSTAHPLTPPAFTSMYTGRSPGHHGILDFIHGTDEGEHVFFTLYDSRDVRCETIWSIANRQNRKVTALNFVMTAPVTPVCGVVIPGMTHWKHLRRHSHPSSLYERLKAQPWFDAKAMCWDFEHLEQATGNTPREEYAKWVTDHIARERQWFQVLKFVMKKEPTDLVSIVFDGVDKIQHLCWEFLDPAIFPKNPEPWHLEIRELCYQYFRELDAALKDIVTMAGPMSRVFIASDHGFGPVYWTIRLNQALQELGYLAWKPGTVVEEKADEHKTLDLDWTKTVAYCPTLSGNGVFIRIADKPGKAGIKAEEYTAFRAKLADQLKAKIVDPSTGKTLIKDVMFRETTFPGPASHLAPDITITISDYSFVSTQPGKSVAEKKESVKGSHYPEGIFFAAGDGIKAGAKLDRMSILDVAPAIIYSLGLPVPSNFEGKLPLAAFEPEFIAENPVEQGAPAEEREDDSKASTETSGEKTKEEKDMVYDQLRALGYIE